MRSEQRINSSYGLRFWLVSAVFASLAITLKLGAAELLLPPTPCYNGVCAEVVNPEPTPTPPSNNANYIKWNPGHYGSATNVGLNAAKTLWPNHPFCQDPRGEAHIEGLSLRLHWRELEEGRGEYTFEIIDEYLRILGSQCGSKPRRLMITVDHQANNSHAVLPADRGGKACAPQYIWDGGGVFEWIRNNDPGRGRCLAQIWKPWVQERYEALVVELGKRYNSHPLVENIAAKGEGALGIRDYDPTFTREAYDAAQFKIARAFRAVAPNTSFSLGTNYHGNHWSKMQPVVDAARAVPGTGMRWPDTFHRPGMAWPTTHGQYFYKSLSGRIGPLAGAHQLPADRGRGTDGYDSAWRHCCDSLSRERLISGETNQEVDATWAATHPVWMRRDDGALFTTENLLRVLENRNGGVYSTACPSDWRDAGFTCRTGDLP